MKVVFVVDDICDINNKINLIKNRFGDNISFVVKNNLASSFYNCGQIIAATYNKNLPSVISSILINTDLEDIVIYYSSLTIKEAFLNKFISVIGDGKKVVNIIPSYNNLEKFNSKIYNIYIKTLFKIKDSMATPKLQFIPKEYLPELLESHFSNRLFEINEEYVKEIDIFDKEINKSAKPHSSFNKNYIFSIIIALLITMSLFLTIAFLKINFLSVILYITLYLLDLFMTLIFVFKAYFDARFFNK